MGWQNGALCCGLTNLYYSEKGNSIEAIVNKTIAKTICSICSCQQQCQEEYDSLPIENQIGIWSGLSSEQQRRRKLQEQPQDKTTINTKQQKDFLSPKTQQRIRTVGQENTEIARLNEWLIYELQEKNDSNDKQN